MWPAWGAAIIRYKRESLMACAQRRHAATAGRVAQLVGQISSIASRTACRKWRGEKCHQRGENACCMKRKCAAILSMRKCRLMAAVEILFGPAKGKYRHPRASLRVAGPARQSSRLAICLFLARNLELLLRCFFSYACWHREEAGARAIARLNHDSLDLALNVKACA